MRNSTESEPFQRSTGPQKSLHGALLVNIVRVGHLHIFNLSAFNFKSTKILSWGRLDAAPGPRLV